MLGSVTMSAFVAPRASAQHRSRSVTQRAAPLSAASRAAAAPLRLAPRVRAASRGVAAAVNVAGAAPRLVQEAMVRDVISLRESQSLGDALRLMLAKKVSGAPVLDAAGKKLVGVLSETDLLWKEAGVPQDEWVIPPLMLPFVDQIVAWRDATAFQSEVKKVLARTVGEAMTSEPITIGPTVPLQEAAQLMLRKKINRLPVVDASGALVGLLTRTDVLKALAAGGGTLPV